MERGRAFLRLFYSATMQERMSATGGKETLELCLSPESPKSKVSGKEHENEN